MGIRRDFCQQFRGGVTAFAHHLFLLDNYYFLFRSHLRLLFSHFLLFHLLLFDETLRLVRTPEADHRFNILFALTFAIGLHLITLGGQFCFVRYFAEVGIIKRSFTLFWGDHGVKYGKKYRMQLNDRRLIEIYAI